MTKEQKEKALAFLKDMQECTYDGVEEIRTAIQCLEQEPCEDCISRADALSDKGLAEFHFYEDYAKMRNYLKGLPSVTPTHGTCKDCAIKKLDKSESEEVGAEKYFCPVVGNYVDETPDFYCTNFKERGSEE